MGVYGEAGTKGENWLFFIDVSLLFLGCAVDSVGVPGCLRRSGLGPLEGRILRMTVDVASSLCCCCGPSRSGLWRCHIWS